MSIHKPLIHLDDIIWPFKVLVYRLGFRPKHGSMLFSYSMSVVPIKRKKSEQEEIDELVAWIIRLRENNAKNN